MTMRFNNLELLKGQSLVLATQLESCFDAEQKELWRSFVETNIIQEFVGRENDGDPIRVATEGQIEFFKVCCEKGLKAEDFLTANNTEDTGIKIQVSIDEAQTPHIDKVSLKRFILARNAQANATENVENTIQTSTVTVGEIEESIASVVPEDQVVLAEAMTNAEVPENVAPANVENTTGTTTTAATVVTRAEEPTIFEVLHLDPVFVEILDEMGANFTYGGVEYGKLSIKEIANMMASGVLPKFKNYRVATSEEIKLFLLATAEENLYNLPDGIVDLILERCKARSKRTTGKWARKRRGEEVSDETTETVTINVPEDQIAMDEILTNDVEETEIAEDTVISVVTEENLNVNADTPNIEELKQSIIERLTSLTEDVENIAKLQTILSML